MIRFRSSGDTRRIVSSRNEYTFIHGFIFYIRMRYEWIYIFFFLMYTVANLIQWQYTKKKIICLPSLGVRIHSVFIYYCSNNFEFQMLRRATRPARPGPSLNFLFSFISVFSTVTTKAIIKKQPCTFQHFVAGIVLTLKNAKHTSHCD